MTNLHIAAFSAACLAIMAAVFAALFPFATMSVEQRARLNNPQSAASLPAIDLGRIYGKVPVSNLLEAYAAKRASAPRAEPGAGLPQFGGC